MPRLELIFLHSANGGGGNARGWAKGKIQLQHGFEHTRARGPYVVGSVMKIPITSATPE
jgi:hypothetical protein